MNRVFFQFVIPIVSIAILVLCTYAGMTEDTFRPSAMLSSSLSTYFFAKSIFCGMAVYLLDRILETLTAAGHGGQ